MEQDFSLMKEFPLTIGAIYAFFALRPDLLAAAVALKCADQIRSKAKKRRAYNKIRKQYYNELSEIEDMCKESEKVIGFKVSKVN